MCANPLQMPGDGVIGDAPGGIVSSGLMQGVIQFGLAQSGVTVGFDHDTGVHGSSVGA